MSDDGLPDGRELRRQLEAEQAALATLRARAAAPVDLDRLSEESHAALEELDLALSMLHLRKKEVAARVTAHAEEARRYEDAKILLDDAAPLDGLSQPVLTVVLALVLPVVAWTIALNPFRDLSSTTMLKVCAVAVAVPLLVLPAQAMAAGRRGAAMWRRR